MQQPAPGTEELEVAPHLGAAVWTLIRTDFKIRYYGTFLGFGWALLKPLVTLLVILVVFSNVFAQTPNYLKNVVVGMLLYEYFQDGTNQGLKSLLLKRHLLEKSSFPRWILVLTPTISPLVTLAAASAGGLLVVVLVEGRLPLLGVLMFGVYVLHMIVIVFGISLALAPLFLRYRDLHQIWDVIAGRVGFFAAPVFWPIELVPPELKTIVYLWPPTSVMELSRAALFTDGLSSPSEHLFLTGLTAAIFLTGVVIYRYWAPRAAELL